MDRVEKFRVFCYITWAVVEPIMLLLIILYANKIIRLLEGLQ